MAAVAGYNSSILVTSPPSVSFTDLATTTSDFTTYTITDATKRYFDPTVAVVVQEAHDEVQTATVTGSPTGGTFTLTFGANTTTGIAFNAAASAVQSALVALASIGSGNVSVSGANGGPYTIEFISSLGLASQSLLTANGSGLTGGSSPGVTIARVQAGAAYATITNGFTLRSAGGIVIFGSAQAQGSFVRFHSGNYMPYSTLGNAASAEFSGKVDLVETTVFNTTGTRNYTPCLMDGTLKMTQWWVNETLLTNLKSRDLLVVSFVSPTGARYEGYCYVSDSGLKADVKKTVDEDLTFQLTNQFFAN